MDRIYYPVEVKRSSPRAVENNGLTAKDDNDTVRTAQGNDLAFNMLRHHPEIRSVWTELNHSLSQNEQKVTTIEYKPIIRAPLHECDTLDTVVKRCMYISTTLYS